MIERKPVVRSPIRRQHAEEYLLITLLSFAGSVSLTRLFLYATGYPQIGNSELHLAHVLWGGLLLYAAALLPLIFANNWVFPLSALLGGVGVGLFIDEVGKFITQTNDYFYPTAAPIIYVFFLLTVLLYQRQRITRQVGNFRADLYYILEDLQEVLDHDLSERERLDIHTHLTQVKHASKDPDLIRLADSIESFIQGQDLYLVAEEKPRVRLWIERIEAYEHRYLNRWRSRAILSGGLAAVAIWALLYPATIVTSVGTPAQMETLFRDLIANRLLRSEAGLVWFQIRLSLEVAVGVILVAAAAFFAVGQERRGFRFAYFGLIFALTVVNVLIFYFDQFSTIINSMVQFILLLMTIRYKARFLSQPGETTV